MRLDDPSIDYDALVNSIYELQTSLRMLSEQLARERQPDLHRPMLQTIHNLHWYLQQQQPSLMRH